jgi:hypothetical protein
MKNSHYKLWLTMTCLVFNCGCFVFARAESIEPDSAHEQEEESPSGITEALESGSTSRSFETKAADEEKPPQNTHLRDTLNRESEKLNTGRGIDGSSPTYDNLTGVIITE